MKVIINIDVPELAPAIEFYTRALGLTHSRTLDDDVAELTGASATLYLLQKDAGTPAVKAPPVDRDYGRHWTPVHFDLVVDDVDAAAKRALAAGATPGNRAHRLARLALRQLRRSVRSRLLLHPVRTRTARIQDKGPRVVPDPRPANERPGRSAPAFSGSQASRGTPTPGPSAPASARR